MNKLYPSLLRQAADKQQKLARRLLKSLRNGTFSGLSSREKWYKVKRLRRLEKRLALGSVTKLKHWAIAAAMGFITFTAGAQQQERHLFGAQEKSRSERLAKLKRLKFTQQLQRKASEESELSFSAMQHLGDPMTEKLLFADLDGDGDQDVVQIGYYDRSQTFINEGEGNYSRGAVLPESFMMVYGAQLADIDSDGDQDMVAPRYYESPLLLLNDGTGHFTEKELHQIPHSGLLTVADFDQDGDLDMFVTIDEEDSYNPSASRGKLYKNNGSMNFEPASQDLSLGQGSIIPADVNGDQVADLVVASHQAEIFINNGSGLFSLSDEIVAEESIDALQVADLDGDQDQDIAVLSAQGLSTYINAADGTFSAGTNIRLVEGFADFSYLAVGDVDQDGDQDVVVSVLDVNQWSDVKRLLLNDGSGNFGVSNADMGSLQDVRDVQLVDVDKDQHLDVVMHSSIEQLFLINKGNGSFSSGTAPPIQVNLTFDAAFGDFDQDGDVDAAVAGVTRLWESKEGRFEAGQELFTLESGYSEYIDAADVDKDGDLDLLVESFYTDNIHLLLNNGQGVFSAYEALSLSEEPKLRIDHDKALFGDLDGDGDVDIAAAIDYRFTEIKDGVHHHVSSSGFAVWMNDGSGSFLGSGKYVIDESSYDIEVRDVNGDDRSEILLLSSKALKVFALNSSGQPTQLSVFSTSQENTELINMACGDLDNDGDVDLLLNNEYGYPLLLVNDGSGNFLEKSHSINVPSIMSLSLGDIDQDDDLDVLLSSEYDGAGFWLNDGSATFTGSIAALEDGGALFYSNLVDLDGDGDLDVWGGAYYSTVRLWHNQLQSSPNGLENAATAGIYVYPNPSQESFYIGFGRQQTGKRWLLEVFSIQGQKLYQQQILSGATTEIKMHALPAGLYLLRLSDGFNSYRQRIVKQ